MAMRRPKPPISQWIVDERKRLGWKPADISRRLKDLGYEAEESTVEVWEAGRKPRDETIEGLERIFGSTAPRDEGDTTGLTAAIRELVDEVRLSRLAQERSAQVLAELIGMAVEGRLPLPGSEDAADAQARPGTR